MSEITHTTDSVNDIYGLYLPEEKEVEEKVEKAPAAPAAEETAEKVEEVAKEVVAHVVAEAKAAPAKKALPAVKLVKLSRDDLKKKDAKLVEKHVPARIKEIKWDEARQVVVIVKSKKERAYAIGHGAAPALIESKNHSDIVDYLNKM
ncbi:MAG: hypothetical protein H7A38_04615 [Chlamydiales bacterium]|nr:hypothetical protein [Chlamydiales bacterium]